MALLFVEGLIAPTIVYEKVEIFKIIESLKEKKRKDNLGES